MLALAAFPGDNGRIAYYDPDRDIYSVNPNGSSATQLTTDPGLDLYPAWSADGRRIAFSSNRGGLGEQVYVMNADGTGQARLTDPPETNAQPAWSPDGQRIIFSRSDGNIWIMDADGTDEGPLISLSGSEAGADWSPDGSRIAFVRDDGGIYTIRPDGAGLTPIVGPGIHDKPDWSPDGSRLVFTTYFPDSEGEVCADISWIRVDGTGGGIVAPATCDGARGNFYSAPAWSPDGLRIAAFGDYPTAGLFTVNVDGTAMTILGHDAFDPDWQPLPVETPGSHARPKSATPVYFPLVPAAKTCTAPNRTHGPPLAFGSCHPVQPGSSRLTIGVGDGNPALARGAGFVRLAVLVGAPGPPDDSDVKVRLNLTNVMRAADRSEYTGELRGQLSVRRTDRDPPGAAPHSTTMDFPFGFTVPCTPTPGSSLDASTCNSQTTVNALVPLAIEDTHGAIWALDKLRVYDGGPDEDADTESGNSLFMTQGVFVP